MLAQQRKIIGIIGFWQWVTLVLCFDEIREWFREIYYCHHNARVIADFEHRMAIVLCECTRGMSKPYYDADTMVAWIQDYQNEIYEDGYKEGCKDTKEEFEGYVDIR